MAADFSKRKFLQLSQQQQHKKRAELLRAAYQGEPEALTGYNELQTWLAFEPIKEMNLKEIADRYHGHLKEAGHRLKEHNLLPHVRQGDKVEGAKPWPLAIYLDNLRSAHNVGSILRTTEAFALGRLYFSAATPFIDNKQVRDAAMGTENWIPCEKEGLLSELPRPIIVLETSPEAVSIYDFQFPETFTLVVGNEEYGCSEQSLRMADHIVEIPLRGRKNSLNVANAFAIAAAEISRQKGKTQK